MTLPSSSTPLISKPAKTKNPVIFQILQIFISVTVALSFAAVIYKSTTPLTSNENTQTQELKETPGDNFKSSISNYRSLDNDWQNDNDYVETYADNSTGTGTGPVVTTSNGDIRGVTLKSRDGRNFTAFYSIPYAQPPVGDLMFQRPQPLTSKWEGIRDGTIRGDEETECLQFKSDKVSGRLDCLYLHVFTPKLPRRFRRNPRLPVLFYILGGAYRFGRANRYGAEYIMDEDVILVLVDYRYGALGHLNSEDGEIPGNQAFHDQVAALRWVQDNIKKFGGDRKKVLIFGNSSGASSVHTHIISPISKGLFSRAISQSGTVVLNPGKVKRPIETVRELGEKLNCTDLESTKALHQCFLDAGGAEVVGHKLENMLFVTMDSVKEGEENNTEVFLPDYPMNLLKRGEFNKDVPWILGSNSAESYYSALQLLGMPDITRILNNNWDEFSPTVLDFHNDVDGNASSSIREFYFGSKDIDLNTRENLTNCLSDSQWVWAVNIAGNYHAKFGGTAYFYYLNHEPISSQGDKVKEGFEPPYGVAHADEVQFFFPFGRFPYIGENSTDFKFSKLLIKTWTDFARTGEVSIQDWTPLNSDPSKSKWLNLTENSQMIDPLPERMNFLRNFPFQLPDFIDTDFSDLDDY